MPPVVVTMRRATVRILAAMILVVVTGRVVVRMRRVVTLVAHVVVVLAGRCSGMDRGPLGQPVTWILGEEVVGVDEHRRGLDQLAFVHGALSSVEWWWWWLVVVVDGLVFLRGDGLRKVTTGACR